MNVMLKSLMVASMAATFATSGMAQSGPTTGAPPSAQRSTDPNMIPRSERCNGPDARLYADCTPGASGAGSGSGSTSTGVGGGGGTGGGAAGGGSGGAGSGGTGGN